MGIIIEDSDAIIIFFLLANGLFHCTQYINMKDFLQWSFRLLRKIWMLHAVPGMEHHHVKGEAHPKMITSYLVVFGALSRMVKARGACVKPFWIYKRLNNCAAPAPNSDDVLVVASLACPAHKNASSLPPKLHHCPARGQRNYSIA